MASPVYLAALVIVLAGIGMTVFGNLEGGTNFTTTYGSFVIIGPLVLALGFAVGLVGGGVSHPFILALLPLMLAIALIAIGVFNIGGLKAYGL